MIVNSSKRSYVISMSPRQYSKTATLLYRMTPTELQAYIDHCFEMANERGKSRKSGAWVEAKAWREKAKLGILVKEGANL